MKMSNIFIPKRILRRAFRITCSLIAIMMVCFSGKSLAWLLQSGTVPVITSENAVYDPTNGSLTIKGEGFQKGAVITLKNANGPVGFSRVKVKGSTKLVISGVDGSDVSDGVDIAVTNPNGLSSVMVHVIVIMAADPNKLTAADVQLVIQQAVAQADASGLKVNV